MNEKGTIRLDLAVSNKLFISRTIAQDIIEKGEVKVDGKVVTKSGIKIDKMNEIEVESNLQSFVSRGGFKLQAAIKEFNLDLNGLICMDVGASSGGFSDCMIQNGAKKVYAIDSGTDQLKDELRKNPAIVSIEKMDIRKLDPTAFEKIDFVSVDVSFISLEKILGHVYSFMSDKSSAVFLVKPQFEAGIGATNKKGVVKNPKIHCKVIDKVYNYAKEVGFVCHGHIESPIKGGDGNVEFLMYVVKEPEKHEDYWLDS